MFTYKKINIKLIMIFALITALFCGGLSASAAQSVIEGAFDLTVENQWTDADHEDYMKLSWVPPTAGGYSYVAYQSTDGGVTYESRSSNYEMPIKVLNVYPDAFVNSKGVLVGENGNYLQQWMTMDADPVGKNLIDVTPVKYREFITNIDSYLKKDGTDYYYDVVMFGSSDSNSSNGDVSDPQLVFLQKYIDTGRGLLFGHDVAITSYYNPNAWPARMGKFARDNFGVSQIVYPAVGTANPPAFTTFPDLERLNGTEIKIVNDGFLLKFPWTLSMDTIYTVPMSHSMLQNSFFKDNNPLHNTIWMQYANPSTNSGANLGTPITAKIWSDTSTNNFYLATYNNTAMIQTGHSTGKSTLAERKIIANTLWYLAQHTTATMMDDRSAIDMAEPSDPTVTRTSGNGGKDVTLLSADDGTNYTYYVEATPITGGAKIKSDIVSEECKTMLKGFYILETDDPNIATTDLSTLSAATFYPATDNEVTTFLTTSALKYLFVQAADHAGNLSKITTLAPPSVVVTLDPSTEKIYKPNRATMVATLSLSGGVTVDTGDVKYLMLPVSDDTIISSITEFDDAAATAAYSGAMNKVPAMQDTYNMYNTDTANPPYGILDNCNLWVMVKAHDAASNTDIYAFEKHTFTNIYTPINIYYDGTTDDGVSLYSKIRVGGYTEEYGVPVEGVRTDLDGTVLAGVEFDKISVIHEDMGAHWTLTNKQQDIDNLELNSLSLDETVYHFEYEKTAGYWWDITFNFVDQNGNPIGDPTSATVEKFAAHDVSGNGVPWFSPYTPPVISGYDPIGYIADADMSDFSSNTLVPAPFPNGFAGYTVPSESTVITIVYDSGQVKVTEKYQLYTGISPENVYLFGDNITSIASGGNFTGTALYKLGYVYAGYSIDGGSTFTDITDFSNSKSDKTLTNIFTDILADSEIIYKYKLDTTNTGIPDEMQRKITVNGVGIDSYGIRTSLYTKVTTAVVGEEYTVEALGVTDSHSNPFVYEKDGTYWILSGDARLNFFGSDGFPTMPIIDPVTKDESYTYYYYKDSGPTGVPDFRESNVSVTFASQDTNSTVAFAPPADYIIYKFSSTQEFSLPAPLITGYAPSGFTLTKDGDTESEVDLAFPVIAHKDMLGVANWTVKFYYKADENNNNIPDDMESKIFIKAQYIYANGTIEVDTREKNGRVGQPLGIDPLTYSDYPASFAFQADSSTPLPTQFGVAPFKTIDLVYKQPQTPQTPDAPPPVTPVTPVTPDPLPYIPPANSSSSSKKDDNKSSNSGNKQDTDRPVVKPPVVTSPKPTVPAPPKTDPYVVTPSEFAKLPTVTSSTGKEYKYRDLGDDLYLILDKKQKVLGTIQLTAGKKLAGIMIEDMLVPLGNFNPSTGA